MSSVLFISLYPIEANTSVSLSNRELLKALIKKKYNITAIMPESTSFNNTDQNSAADIIDKIKVIRIDEDER